ncbi:hypothetical protein L596_000400 [Steinernema carpocapsae]|uniref:Uncharacterized protein n=1 Tax=Steinernema carpocapsae TaxID=34508 RepID=A0A4U8UHX9_STECR|nr:hypothetical protein L596_000400 [Steinernema carpocapsae]
MKIAAAVLFVFFISFATGFDRICNNHEIQVMYRRSCPMKPECLASMFAMNPLRKAKQICCSRGTCHEEILRGIICPTVERRCPFWESHDYLFFDV